MGRRKSKEKKSNFVTQGNSDIDVYKRGAFLGAIAGGVAALIIRKRIILCIIGGAIAGGYIAHSINKKDDTLSLKKFKESDTAIKTEDNGK